MLLLIYLQVEYSKLQIFVQTFRSRVTALKALFEGFMEEIIKFLHLLYLANSRPKIYMVKFMAGSEESEHHR